MHCAVGVFQPQRLSPPDGGEDLQTLPGKALGDVGAGMYFVFEKVFHKSLKGVGQQPWSVISDQFHYSDY